MSRKILLYYKILQYLVNHNPKVKNQNEMHHNEMILTQNPW